MKYNVSVRPTWALPQRTPSRLARNRRRLCSAATTSRRRIGRALVECLVAIFLLAISALSVAATTRSTLALADDSALVTHAQAMVTTRVEDALTSPCATSGSGVDQLPRMDLVWQQSGTAQTAQLQIDLTLVRSPIAVGAGAPIQSVLAAGGVCP